jgi:hypothetical protein
MSVELENPLRTARVREPFAQAEGVTPPSAPNGRPGFLSDVIIEMGFADRELVDEVVDQSRLVGKVAEEILVENGNITEEQLARAIAERNGLPFVDLSTFAVDEGAQGLVGVDTAVRYRAVPIAFDADDALVVALADPLDALAVSDIGVITKSEVRTAVATDSGIGDLLADMPTRAPRRLAPEPDTEGGVAPSELDEPGAWSLSQSISTAGPVEPAADEPDVFEEPSLPPLLSRTESEPLPELDRVFEDVLGSAPEPPPVPDLSDVSAEPGEPYEPYAASEPAELDPPAVADDQPPAMGASPALQDRIAGMIAAALDDVTVSEVERLETELASEREAREQVERRTADEDSAREQIATALEQATAEIDLLNSRLEELERTSLGHEAERDQYETERDQYKAERDQYETERDQLKAERDQYEAERDQYKAERDQLRETAADAQSESAHERDLRIETEARLRERLTRAAESSDGLESSIEQLATAIAGAREASAEVATIHRELTEGLDPSN